MVEGNVLFKVEECSQWLSNESQVVELECKGSERKHEKESNQIGNQEVEGGSILHSGDKSSGYV